MPRYFFHIHLGPQILIDTDGHFERTVRHAWDAARTAARDLMRVDTDGTIDWKSCHFAIVEEGSDVVLDCPFIEADAPASSPSTAIQIAEWPPGLLASVSPPGGSWDGSEARDQPAGRGANCRLPAMPQPSLILPEPDGQAATSTQVPG